MQCVDEACDVEGGQHGEDFLVGGGCDLLDLKTLGDYVLVGNHYLFSSAFIHSIPRDLSCCLGSG